MDFWIYGPTTDFFEGSFTSQRYTEIVDDILYFTQVRGIQLGLDSSNEKVQELSLGKARDLFNQYTNSEQGEFKETLGNSLKRFIKEGDNSEADLQALAKAFVYEIPGYNIDDLRLSQLRSDQIKQEISQLESLCSKVKSIFSSAIHASGKRAISDFFLKQKNICIDLVSSWIERLEKQTKSISVLSISQKANGELIASILNSVKNHDESLYQQISTDVYLIMQMLNSSSMQTKEEQNDVNSLLNEIKQQIHLSLSNKLNTLKSEVSSLEHSSSETEATAKDMLKTGVILLAVSVFSEFIASLISIFTFIVIIGVGLAASAGG